MASVGTVIIDVKADTAKLVSGMDKAERTIKRSVANIQKTIITLATAYAGIQGIRAFRNMIDDSLDAADATGKLAQKLGLTTDALSEYQYTAKFAAVSNGELNAGLSALVRRLSNFQRTGGGAAKTAFQELGISAEYARKHFTDTDTAFKEILKRLEKMPDGFRKTAIAQDIFSKSASSIMRITSSDLQKFSEEAKKIGISISQSTYEMAAAYHDEMDRVEARFTGLGYRIANDLLPSITKIATEMTKILDGESKYNKTISDLTTMAEILGVAAVAAKGYSTATSLAASANLVFTGSFGALNRAIILTTASTKALALATRSIPYVAAAAGLYTMYELIKASSDDVSIAEREMRDYAESINLATTATIDFQLAKMRKRQSEINKSMNEEASITYGSSISPHYEKLANDATVLSEKIDILIKKKKELLAVNEKIKIKDEPQTNQKNWQEILPTLDGSSFNGINKMSEEINKKFLDDKKKTAEALKKIDEDTNADYIAKLIEWEEEDKQALLSSIQTHKEYISIVGTDYDKWLQSTNNKMAKLAEDGSLSAQQLQQAWDSMQSDYEINLTINGLDDMQSKFDDMIDSQISLATGVNDWGNNLTGVAKNFANVAKSISAFKVNDLKFEKTAHKLKTKYAKDSLKIEKSKIPEEQKVLKQKELAANFDKDYAQAKNQQFSNELNAYSNLAGAIGSFYEAGSTAAKAAQAVQATLGIVNGYGAITQAWASAPFPANLPGVAAATAAVLPMIAQLTSLGGSGGSGGGSGNANVKISERNIKNIEADYAPITDRLDRQIELLKSIDLKGSAETASVKNAKLTYEKDYKIAVQEALKHFTANAYEKYAIKDGWSFDAMSRDAENFNKKSHSNVFSTVRNDYNRGYVHADRRELAKGNTFLELLDTVANSGKFTWMFNQGWGDSGLGPGAYGQQQARLRINDYQKVLHDYTMSVIGSMKSVQDASESMKENYDKLTGTAYYENKKLKDAYDDVAKIAKGQSLSDYMKNEIGKMDGLSKFLSKKTLDTLITQDPKKLKEQLTLVDELQEKTGLVFKNGASDALDYLESISAVSEAMAKSRENIKSFEDSFKTDKQLLQDKASALGVGGIANSKDELMSLFASLKGGLGGLTDAELDFLNANKDYLESTKAIVKEVEYVSKKEDQLKEIFKLTHSEREYELYLRREELETLDTADKQRQLYIYTLRDEKKAQEEAAKALEKAQEEAAKALEKAQEEAAKALAASNKNIKTFEDSFKTKGQLVNDMAKSLGVSSATTEKQLMKLFNSLKGGVGGLTNSELDFLNANKDLIESNKDLIESNNAAIADVIKSIHDMISELSHIPMAFDAISSTASSLRNDILGTKTIDGAKNTFADINTFYTEGQSAISDYYSKLSESASKSLDSQKESLQIQLDKAKTEKGILDSFKSFSNELRTQQLIESSSVGALLSRMNTSISTLTGGGFTQENADMAMGYANNYLDAYGNVAKSAADMNFQRGTVANSFASIKGTGASANIDTLDSKLARLNATTIDFSAQQQAALEALKKTTINLLTSLENKTIEMTHLQAFTDESIGKDTKDMLSDLGLITKDGSLDTKASIDTMRSASTVLLGSIDTSTKRIDTTITDFSVQTIDVENRVANQMSILINKVNALTGELAMFRCQSVGLSSKIEKNTQKSKVA